MKQVNDATANTLENFRRKAKDLPFSAHPYSGMKEALTRLGKTEWDDEHRKSAIGAMIMWVMGIVGNSIASTLNEVVALMRIAAETGDEEHKKAAEEMASSMSFAESVFKSFMGSLDFEHIAEQLFEDGLQIEKERAEEAAAAEAAKAKVKAFAEQKKQEQAEAPEAQLKTGTLHTRWQPSVN